MDVITELTYDVYWEDGGTLASPKGVKTQHVLYQLMGQHMVYGHRALLYIGKTEQLQPTARLTSHQKTWGQFEPDHIEVRVASIGEFHSWKEWNVPTARYPRLDSSDVVAAVEALLIYVHQPAYNSQGLRKAPEGPASQPVSHLRIFNTGLSGPLLPEVSTRRYTDLVRPLKDEG